MSDSEIDQNLDDDGEVSKSHSKLIEAVAKLDKGRRISQPERNEPATQISEYHLVKSGVSDKDVVRIQDLAKSLGRKGYQTEIIKKLRKNKVLAKPLEKPVAERIKRAVGYESVKNDLAKWKGLIAKNRTAPRLTFPLRRPTEVKESPTTEFLKRFRTKSDLMQELEKMDPPSENLPTAEEERNNTFKLTKQEMILRRKEIARFRAQQSYREAKARRDRKIKSKNYHRIQRKHKIKQQLKEFEELQKSNPQEALLKLEQIDKIRAEERMSLRHRSTGQWAKNKQIRAKYNKEARQVLSEQLAINRDLTQKIKAPNDDDEDEDEEDEDEIILNDNEKKSEVKTESEVDAFIKSYRKYWDEKHQQEKQKKVAEVDHGSNPPAKKDDTVNSVNQIKEKKKENKTKSTKCRVTSNDKVSKKKKQAKGNDESETPRDAAVTTSESHVEELQHDNADEKQCNKKSKVQDIDEMFDSLEEKLKRKIDQKLQKVQKKLKTNSETKKPEEEKSEEEEDEDISGFEFRDRNSKKRPILDQPLEETTSKESAQESNNLTDLKIAANTEQRPTEEMNRQEAAKEIDPDKYLNVKPRYIKTQLPDMVTGEDENSEQEDETHRIMSEAFADDDVVEEFRKEKEEEEGQKSQEPDPNQPLPGWGSWVGPSWNENVEKKKRKKKKNRRKSKMIILNIAKEAPRKEENKGKVIIFEHENEKLKKHLVNELPHPFTSIKDYEASIRAPISRTFVSENAHSRMIQPAVTTKLGQIIEPVNEDALIKMQPMQMPKGKQLKRRFDRKNAAKNNKKRRK